MPHSALADEVRTFPSGTPLTERFNGIAVRGAHISSVKVFVFHHFVIIGAVRSVHRVIYENDTTKNQNIHEWKLPRILCSENENRH